MRMSFLRLALALGLGIVPPLFSQTPGPVQGNPYRGVELAYFKNARDIENIQAQIPLLAAKGMNVLVLEVNYFFQFQSHPEVTTGYALSKAQARALAAICRQYGVRLVPMFEVLGHQSSNDGSIVFNLLAKHPEFDETPGIKPEYVKSWCPLAPGLDRFVFDLLKEITEAFQADAFHLGLDEVFIMGQDARCKGRNNASLLAQTINTFSRFLKDSCRVTEVQMWGDRLLPLSMGYGRWESSDIGTEAAIDSIPKDIVMCDWHYGVRTDYPSLKYFVDKGFRVWPCGWRDVAAVKAFIDNAESKKSDKVIGFLSSVWGEVDFSAVSDWQPVTTAFSWLGRNDATPPSNVVQRPLLSARGTDIQLSWNFSVDAQSGVAGYEIYRDTSAAPTKLFRKITYNLDTFTDSTAVAGKRYHYRLRAFNRRGLMSPEYSNETWITAGAITGLHGHAIQSGRNAAAGRADVSAGLRRYAPDGRLIPEHRREVNPVPLPGRAHQLE